MRLINWGAAKAACGTVIVGAVTLVLFAPAANAATCTPPTANSLTFCTTGAAEQFSLGNALGILSNYDQLKTNGSTGTFGTGQIVLNQLEFIVGVNAIVPHDYNNVFSFTEFLKLSDGSGTAFTVPFNLSINYSDSLTIVAGTTFSF